MTKTTNKLVLLVLLCMMSTISFGQVKKNISGVIKDSSGSALPGISISVKGTRVATSSDQGGNFKIAVPPNGTTLVFTSIGYQDQEVRIGGNETLNIIMHSGGAQLGEVVVTGFGETRAKRNLGYSVTQVSGDDLRRANTANPIVALQGMVPGLQVSPGTSGPSATPRFLIRGSSSLDPYGNTPLIVVDNVIMDEQTVTPNKSTQYNSNTDFGNILKDLNMDDIESITVLKGGAVTALYGSRANNGVILIKSKKGITQKGLGVSFSQTVQVDQAYKTVDFQNLYGAGFSTNDMDTLSNGQLQINPASNGISFGPKMTGQSVLDPSGHLQKNQPFDPLDLFRKGFTSNTNVAFSGADDKSSFRFSYSNQTSNAVSPNNKFGRNSFNIRGTRKVADGKLLVDGNVSYANTKVWNPALQGGSSPLYGLAYNIGARNYDLAYWKDHYIDTAKGGVNPNDPLGYSGSFFSLYQNNTFQTENTFLGSLDLTANIKPWLRWNGQASLNVWDREWENDQRGQNPGFANPNYKSSVNNTITTRFKTDFTAQKTFNDFYTQLQVGGELSKGQTKGIYYQINGALYPDVYRLSNTANTFRVGQDIIESSPSIKDLNSLFGQATIEWRKFLTLNLYARNDWNSTLVYNDAHGKYSYLYGGADMAWVFTDVIKFPKFFNYGKLRFSYALTGNGTGVYQANTGAYAAGIYSANVGGNINTAFYSANTLPNQNLKPERSSKIETGIEFKMFKNRLGGDLTYYSQDTKNQIIPFAAPNTSGVQNILTNGGLVRNSGIELSLFGTPVLTKNFRWLTMFNYTRNSNKIITLPLSQRYQTLAGEDGVKTIAEAGGDYADMVAAYGYNRYQATDASGAKINSPLNSKPIIYPRGGGTRMAYQRASDYGTDDVSREPVLGSTLPKFMGSWRNTFTYKNFALNVFLDSKFGGLVYSTTYNYGSETGMMANTLVGRDASQGGVTYTPAAGSTNAFGVALGTSPRTDGLVYDAVFAPNSSTKGADGAMHDVSGMTYANAVTKGLALPTDVASANEYKYGWGFGIREASTFKSSWVSLREISLSYDFPQSFINKLKLNGAQFIISARNIIYLYNSAPDHVNPDFLSDSGSGSAFEEGGIPYIRSFSATVRASF